MIRKENQENYIKNFDRNWACPIDGSTHICTHSRAFILLFEFIILLADTWIHNFTHGEPWKVLAIKVALIAILLPLHHFLEERVIHYIVHRKHKNNPTVLEELVKN